MTHSRPIRTTTAAALLVGTLLSLFSPSAFAHDPGAEKPKRNWPKHTGPVREVAGQIGYGSTDEALFGGDTREGVWLRFEGSIGYGIGDFIVPKIGVEFWPGLGLYGGLMTDLDIYLFGPFEALGFLQNFYISGGGGVGFGGRGDLALGPHLSTGYHLDTDEDGTLGLEALASVRVGTEVFARGLIVGGLTYRWR